jgi:hypothetical protein
VHLLGCWTIQPRSLAKDEAAGGNVTAGAMVPAAAGWLD